MDAVKPGRGVNEILAITDHGSSSPSATTEPTPTPPNAPQSPNLKRLYKIDLAKPGPTDVSASTACPRARSTAVAPSLRFCSDRLVRLQGERDADNQDVIPEKIEGPAW